MEAHRADSVRQAPGHPVLGRRHGHTLPRRPGVKHRDVGPTTPEMPRFLRAIALATSLIVLASACSITTPLTSPATTSSTSIPDGLASEDSTARSDSTISFDEYEAGLDALERCMGESGAAINGRILDPITNLYVYSYDPAYEAIHVECYAANFQAIDQLYRDGPREDRTAGQFDGAAGPGDLSDLDPASWVRRLATVPDTPETRFNPITILDVGRVRETYDIVLPAATAGDAEVVEYQGALTASAGLLPIGPMAAFGRLVTPTEMRLEVGFDQRAWDRLIAAGQGDREHLAIAGRFDAGAIATAVQNDPVWNDLLQPIEHAGITIYEWGADGGLDLERTTPVRSIGAFQRLALVEGFVLWMRFTDAVQDGIDSILGRRRTLADVPELRRLAEIADEDALISALMTMRLTPYVGYADNGRIETVLLDQPLALMLGDGADSLGDFVSMHLLYDSAENAEANIAPLEQRIVDAAETSVADDTFVTLASARQWDIVQRDDVLVARIWKTRDRLPPPLTIIRFG